MVGRTNSQIDQLHAKFTQRQTSSSILQQRTQNKLQNIKWDIELHPPYYPDISSCGLT